MNHSAHPPQVDASVAAEQQVGAAEVAGVALVSYRLVDRPEAYRPAAHHPEAVHHLVTSVAYGRRAVVHVAYQQV